MRTKVKRTKVKRIEISQEADVAEVVYETKLLADSIGFKKNEQFMISTAASELARNIVLYAMKGNVTLRVLNGETKKGIEIIAEDNGPGIEDIGKAMKDHFSTSHGLGLGLPGTKRLMDEFAIDRNRKVGTKITVRKWVYNRR